MDSQPVSSLDVSVQPPLPPHVLQKFSAQSQLDFELEFYTRILQSSPNYLDVLRVHGNNLTAKGELSRGLAVDQHLARLCPEDGIVLYNLACSYSRLKMVEQALRALTQALEHGYNEFDYLQEDRDLENLRKDPRFRTLLEHFGVK